MHDFVNKKLPHSFDSVFRLNSDIRDDHVTRQSGDMNVPRCNSALSRKLPLFNFPIVWNTWNRTLSTYTSRSVIKKILKSHILATYSASIKCNNQYCRQCSHV